MTLLILGLIVWTAPHLFKAVAPAARERLGARLGAGPSRGLFAVLIVLGLVLVILGYRSAPVVNIWFPPTWTVHLNNLLMLVAVFVFGLSMSRGRSRSWMRHPQLTAVVIWAVAHLLVNGDLASLVLFGWMAVWALSEMAAINARDGAWVRPEPGTRAGDIRLVVITVVLFAVIVAVHTWLGYPPFMA